MEQSLNLFYELRLCLPVVSFQYGCCEKGLTDPLACTNLYHIRFGHTQCCKWELYRLMICLLPELCSLPFFKVLVSVSIGIPKAVESIISELLGDIFNITMCNSKTFILVLWTLQTLWGLSAADGTMQAAVLFSDCAAVNFPISAVSACTHGWTDVPLGDNSGEASPKVSRLSDLTWMYLLTGVQQQAPSSQPCGPILLHTSAFCCGSLEKPHMCKLNEIQLLFFFRFFYFACMLYRLRMQKSNPLFFPLLIIQYCNIFNIK